MADERKDTIEYYERIRQQQKAEGTYNPYRNGNPEPGGGDHIDSRYVIQPRRTMPNDTKRLFTKDGFYKGQGFY